MSALDWGAPNKAHLVVDVHSWCTAWQRCAGNLSPTQQRGRFLLPGSSGSPCRVLYTRESRVADSLSRARPACRSKLPMRDQLGGDVLPYWPKPTPARNSRDASIKIFSKWYTNRLSKFSMNWLLSTLTWVNLKRLLLMIMKLLVFLSNESFREFELYRGQTVSIWFYMWRFDWFGLSISKCKRFTYYY